jgi:hypothetical protein
MLWMGHGAWMGIAWVNMEDGQMGLKHSSQNITCLMGYVSGVWCRNPTLAKRGGEAQHLEKVRTWSPPGLPNVQSLTARPKTPRIEVFLVSLVRS